MKLGGSGKSATARKATTRQECFGRGVILRFLFERKERIPNVHPFTQARDTAGIRKKASHPRSLAGETAAKAREEARSET